MAANVEPFHAPSGPAYVGGVACRTRIPDGAGPYPLLILLHGFQGDENVTWIFTRAAGPEWLVISPRAPLRAADGYSWYTFDANGHTEPDSLFHGLDYLTAFIDAVKAHYPIDPARIVIGGFSQGGAMSYAYAFRHPDQVVGVISLAGFIPGPLSKVVPPLPALPILILHGTNDETISVEIARKNRQTLIGAGAAVSYLEDPVGHKVGAGGMRLLASWLADRLRPTP